jgi:hypothetical protein
MMRNLFICFSAGCLGALANSLTVWLLGDYGITKAMGVMISPSLTPNWLYPRIVWGGLWGFLFALPIMNSKTFSKGAVLSLFPTVFQLLVVFPYQMKKGFGGMELGALTPVFVLFVNWVWGVATSVSIRLTK